MTSSSDSASLTALLQRAFGFSAFRLNQEAVCRAAIEGDDLLLVMPTGSGKSLCYQLPAIALGGTALVVSPLIALMDDQAAKLTARGFAVGRIHSGLERSAARQTCVDYLHGRLQFLFIAPERLRVSGFPEMLARRKPCLIAIDEAHCISQWGHDFRPDYRMLGQYLPSLRPARVMALTATATPAVQKDIAAQLGLIAPALFIHGFRRENLAIEVVEVPQPRRNEIVRDLLKDPAARPAIVYSATRKQADTLAAELSLHLPAAAYHAGLDAETRERAQEQFLGGRIDAIAATIAFGMGIDKPDVRTVIHTALPASLEGYYQEIGRAGRDGKPSRTLLMHSYADQRVHGFFLQRDYPPMDALGRVFQALGAEAQARERIREILKMDAEVFDKALEKLTLHGGADVDYAGQVKRGRRAWQSTYAAQAEHRRAQMELVVRYAEGRHQCRMLALVRHFGDVDDGQMRCGICDFCRPRGCLVQQFRPLNRNERQVVRDAIEALRSAQPRSTGKLQKDLDMAQDMRRDAFEELLGAMCRAGLIDIETAGFQKDGKTIAYRQATLTERGQAFQPASKVDLLLRRSSRPARS